VSEDRVTAPQNAANIYEFSICPAEQSGWWLVRFQYATKPGMWEVVARVFGERSAEIVRDALSEEANERV
jgi:hypothetical protein